MPIGDGKATEKKVKDAFEAEAGTNPCFDFERLYDARAARGKFPPQTSDYHVDFNGKSIYVECKETIDPDTLSVSNFPQFSRIKRKEMAGAKGLLVVYHVKEKVYRLVPLAEFPLSTSTFKLSSYLTYKKLDQLIGVLEGL